MVVANDFALLISEGLIILLAGAIIYTSMRAFRRTHSKAMLAMCLGFTVFLVGTLGEEIAVELLGYQMIEAHILENSIVAIGLFILVYSIYGVRD